MAPRLASFPEKEKITFFQFARSARHCPPDRLACWLATMAMEARMWSYNAKTLMGALPNSWPRAASASLPS
jgi:hypothetical protein